VTNVFDNFDRPGAGGDAAPVPLPGPGPAASGRHEQVVFCHDAPSGLRAIIAIYSTALGPSLGGTRFYPYQSEGAALADVLNLSRAMAYKNSMAGLDHGGGKAVIIGDPLRLKSEALLRAYGRFVQSLSGRYITACDVGTSSEDMDIVARECRHVTGRTLRGGGAGDSSLLTAFGVFQGMRATAEHVWGTDSLEGRVDKVRARHPGVEVAADRESLAASAIDVFSPCALGGAVNDANIPLLQARIICGGANNQLAHPGIEKVLADRGIVYAPDYVVNSGGVIQVADEIGGFSFERAQARAAQIFDITKRILVIADDEGVPPAVAADRLAERRISEIGRLRGIWLGS